jgi:hypothetical protein
VKQLILENPRRRRRIRRNGGTLNYGMRTPVSSLFNNGGSSEFEMLFKNRKRKSRKGRKRTKRKTSVKRRSRRTGAKRIRKNKTRRYKRQTPRTKRRTYMKIRKNRSRRGGMAGVKGFASQFVKRENLSLAGGVILAPIATGFVAKLITLPTLGSANVSKAVYSLLIPGLGAILTRRFSPALANGMIIGGIANAVSGLIPQLQNQTATAQRYLGEYLDPRRSMGAYIAPRQNATMGASVPNAFNAWAK